jgi:hypothetical protein
LSGRNHHSGLVHRFNYSIINLSRSNIHKFNQKKEINSVCLVWPNIFRHGVSKTLGLAQISSAATDVNLQSLSTTISLNFHPARAMLSEIHETQ